MVAGRITPALSAAFADAPFGACQQARDIGLVSIDNRRCHDGGRHHNRRGQAQRQTRNEWGRRGGEQRGERGLAGNRGHCQPGGDKREAQPERYRQQNADESRDALAAPKAEEHWEKMA